MPQPSIHQASTTWRISTIAFGFSALLAACAGPAGPARPPAPAKPIERAAPSGTSLEQLIAIASSAPPISRRSSFINAEHPGTFLPRSLENFQDKCINDSGRPFWVPGRVTWSAELYSADIPIAFVCRITTGESWGVHLNYPWRGEPGIGLRPVQMAPDVAAAEAAKIDQIEERRAANRRDWEATQQKVEAEREAAKVACVEKERLETARIQKSPKVGDEVTDGLIVDVRGSLVLLQPNREFGSLGARTEWVKSALLRARMDCRR